jgi:2-polyprenyl-3-methyl-5-hydroxy-6-metoxy-1,4-benzoquinol methylase
VPDDRLMTASLAYRKNEAAILRGDVPEKYLRLLPFIPRGRIIELGSAEGVLAALLAQRGDTVTAVERKRERHEAALKLADQWGVSGVTFVCGDIADCLSRLDGHDTLVAVRMIYYLRDRLDDVFSEVASKINNVVLCGNKNRAAMWRDCIPDRPDGAENYYASPEGMKAVLLRHGYEIVQEVTEGDPIVVGRKDL